MNQKALEEAFSLFDKDGDGCITSEELFTVMKGLGQQVTDEETKKMIQKVDKDGNGLIDLNEFIQMMGSKLDHPVKKDSEVRSLFAAFDKDNSGFIDKSELKNTMRSVGLDLTDRDVDTMMKAAGVVDKDKIFYEDFVKLMSNVTPQKKSLRIGDEPALIYSPEDKKVQDLRIAFSMFDKDGDGKISGEEVFQTLNSIGMKVDLRAAKKMVKQVDLDGNGSICFEEFQQLMRNHYGSSISLVDGGLDLKEMFLIFDKDHDGYLSASDLKDTMQQLGISLSDKDVYDMMKTVNVERNGKISYQDFQRLFYLNEEKLSRMSSMASMASLNNVIKSKGQDKEGLQAVFSLFDKDGDGFITMEEVQKVLRTMNISTSQEYIREIFEQVDMDGNGRIDFEEFVLLTSRYKSPQSDEQEIEEMFNLIDKDRSGSIEVNELKEAFVAIGVPISDRDVAEMMREAKVEGDTIYYEDFLRIMKMLHLTPPTNDVGPRKRRTSEKSNSQKFVQEKTGTTKEPVEHKSSNQRSHRISTSSHSSTTSNPWVAPTTPRRRRSSSTTWEAFKVFDQNCDGYISKRELFDTMKQLGIKLTIEDLNEMMKQADINGDGKIDYSEFVKLMTGTFESYAEQAALMHRQSSNKSNASPKDLPGDEEMRASFKVFDINGDGFIDSSELRQTLKSFGNQITDEEVGKMLKTADTNNDGRIDYEEFIQILHSCK